MNKGSDYGDREEIKKLILDERYTRAWEICDELLSNSDKPDPDILNMKGITLTHLTMYREAINCYDTAIKLSSENPRTLIYMSNKGRTLVFLGRLNEALACYERILSITPEDQDAKEDLENTKELIENPCANFVGNHEIYGEPKSIDEQYKKLKRKYQEKSLFRKIFRKKPLIDFLPTAWR